MATSDISEAKEFGKPALCQKEPQKNIGNETVDGLASQIDNLEMASGCDTQTCSNIQQGHSDISDQASQTELPQYDGTICKELLTFCDKLPSESFLIVTPEHEDCKETHDRLEFLPLTEFNTIQIPQRHRNKQMFKFIKLYAKLTVKISVKLTSQRTKSGSGWIGNVTKISDGRCRCKECRNSTTARTSWWEIDVFVAPDLVKNKSESGNATLFYDSVRENSPLVILEVVRFIKAKGENWLTCATHDKEIGSKLLKLRKRFFSLWLTFSDKRGRNLDSEGLAFMVVHPSESPKHIVFGKWVVDEQAGNVVILQGNVTSAIPGCNGAPVCTVGQSYFEPYSSPPKMSYHARPSIWTASEHPCLEIDRQV